MRKGVSCRDCRHIFLGSRLFPRRGAQQRNRSMGRDLNAPNAPKPAASASNALINLTKPDKPDQKNTTAELSQL